MQRLSDRLQKRVKAAPELTVLCEFSATIQVRRLLQVPPRAWQVLEVRWCAQILEKLETLKKQKGPEATLALACLGFARGDLPKALKAVGLDPTPTPAEMPEPLIKPLAETPDEELAPAEQAPLDELKVQATP
jgi:hypothetical protein